MFDADKEKSSFRRWFNEPESKGLVIDAGDGIAVWKLMKSSMFVVPEPGGAEGILTGSCGIYVKPDCRALGIGTALRLPLAATVKSHVEAQDFYSGQPVFILGGGWTFEKGLPGLEMIDMAQEGKDAVAEIKRRSAEICLGLKVPEAAPSAHDVSKLRK